MTEWRIAITGVLAQGEGKLSERFMRREHILRLLLLISLLVILPGAAMAQTVRIGSLGLSGPLLPLWIAQDRGLFSQQGLKTEVVTFQGGATTIQALMAGENHLPPSGTAAGVKTTLGSADGVAIAGLVNNFALMFIPTRHIVTARKPRKKKNNPT